MPHPWFVAAGVMIGVPAKLAWAYTCSNSAANTSMKNTQVSAVRRTRPLSLIEYRRARELERDAEESDR